MLTGDGCPPLCVCRPSCGVWGPVLTRLRVPPFDDETSDLLGPLAALHDGEDEGARSTHPERISFMTSRLAPTIGAWSSAPGCLQPAPPPPGRRWRAVDPSGRAGSVEPPRSPDSPDNSAGRQPGARVNGTPCLAALTRKTTARQVKSGVRPAPPRASPGANRARPSGASPGRLKPTVKTRAQARSFHERLLTATPPREGPGGHRRCRDARPRERRLPRLLGPETQFQYFSLV